MTHDRPIEISTGASRKCTEWTRTPLLWSQLAARLRAPLRSTETLADYLALPADKQSELKDRGGFVGGTLKDGRRKAGNVQERHVLALDLDSIPEGCTDEALRRVEGLGVAYILYSTRKHCPAAPRLRVLVLLDRGCTAGQYEPLARLCAHLAGVLEWADPTTFEASRLMYWPTACADGEYVYRVGDHPMLDRDEALGTYADWRDASAWPQAPGEERKAPLHHAAARQGNPGCMGEQGTQFPTSPGCIPQAAAHPEMKSGIVGAFCRAYDIYRAMAELLPGVYVPTDMPRLAGASGSCSPMRPYRYTSTGGTTAGGAVVYDGGKFLYSFHATDPCGGELVNAYDLVRLHRFGELDWDCPPDMPVYRRPSMRAMKDFALGLPEIKRALEKESAVREGNPPSGLREVNPPSGLRPGTHGRAVCEAHDQPATSLAKGGKGAYLGPLEKGAPAIGRWGLNLAGAGEEPSSQDLFEPPSVGGPVVGTRDLEDWTSLLARNQQTGAILKTVNNVVLVLENDPRFAGLLVLDEFSQRKLVVGDLPWQAARDRRPNGAAIRTLPVAQDAGASSAQRARPAASGGEHRPQSGGRSDVAQNSMTASPSRLYTDYDNAQLIRTMEHEYGLAARTRCAPASWRRWMATASTW